MAERNGDRFVKYTYQDSANHTVIVAGDSLDPLGPTVLVVTDQVVHLPVDQVRLLVRTLIKWMVDHLSDNEKGNVDDNQD